MNRLVDFPGLQTISDHMHLLEMLLQGLGQFLIGGEAEGAYERVGGDFFPVPIAVHDLDPSLADLFEFPVGKDPDPAFV